MKIGIIGGGPSGLYLAILLKKQDARHEITIYERNGPNDTFGWGVVFSDKTLRKLRDYDAESYDSIAKAFALWENVAIVKGEDTITIRGNRFAGLQRLEMLQILSRRAEALGAKIQFNTFIPDPEALRDHDLVVGADGVNSLVRQRYTEQLKPDISTRPNKYIWWGTRQLFHALTLTFREFEGGVFAAHSYKFNRDMSTFIVECDYETWSAAGFENMTEAQSAAYLERVFARDLGGNNLLSNKSQWINFLLVKNRNWYFENVVLLGDALHTAHFSIGSGTKLALEDSIALFEALQEQPSVGAALELFTERRKPQIDEYQQAAYESLVWFEHARDYMHLDPLSFAYKLMMRSKRIDHENLRKRDPEFIARYEAAQTTVSS